MWPKECGRVCVGASSVKGNILSTSYRSYKRNQVNCSSVIAFSVSTNTHINTHKPRVSASDWLVGSQETKIIIKLNALVVFALASKAYLEMD